MRTADQPLVWVDGPRERGCKYHKCARFELAGDTIQIDVFVMPEIAASRPIAVTVGRYRNYQQVKKFQYSIPSADRHVDLLYEVNASLDKLGCHAELSAYRADEVSEQVKRDALAITAALGGVVEPL